jgi:acyl carrier protein
VTTTGRAGPEDPRAVAFTAPENPRTGVEMTAATGIDEVRTWILTRHPERQTIEADENLIESRLVDSLTFVELVYVIENATGVEIDFDAIDILNFQTLSAIEKAFFAAA